MRIIPENKHTQSFL